MALPSWLLHTPSLVIAEGRLQTAFLRIDAHLMQNKGELAEINSADPFQIIYFSKSPVLIFLLWENTNVHQNIYRGGIAPLLALMVHGGMYLSDQLSIIHFYSLTILENGCGNVRIFHRFWRPSSDPTAHIGPYAYFLLC